MEALRILAMFMVIVLHYLDKGGLLTPSVEPFGAHSYMAWLVESFSIVAVNIYVLITGYFMCKSSLKISRLLQIICQVLWYSMLIPIMLVLLGNIKMSTFGTYDLLQFVFPIHMKQYWFVTSYVILMLFVPMINLAIKHMNQRQLLLVTCLFVAFETLPKSILPVKFTTDEAGNNALWIICLYLIGAYIRLYGIPFFRNFLRSMLVYVIGSLGMFSSLIVMRVLYFKADVFGNNLNLGYHYNHILCLAASVALFYAFLHISIPDGKISRGITMVSPYVFGVYLLHEHILVRYEWVKWFRVAPTKEPLMFIGELLWKCLAVLLIGLLLDFIRAEVFRLCKKILQKTRLVKGLDRLDACLKG